MAVQFEVLTGNAASIKTQLDNYLQTKDPHSLLILGFHWDGAIYHVLVRYRDATFP